MAAQHFTIRLFPLAHWLTLMESTFWAPAAVLELLLSFVPLAERLGTCCLVSKRFRKAAIKVTQSVQVDLQSDIVRDSSFRAWWEQHEQGVSSLQLQHPYRKLSHLRWSNLRDLDVTVYMSQLGTEQHSDLLVAATGLTRLRIEAYDILSQKACQAAAALQHLRHLDLKAWFVHVPDDFLKSGVTQLTHVGLCSLRDVHHLTSLTHLTATTGLRSLKLDLEHTAMPASLLAAIPHLKHLQHLELCADVDVSCSTMPGFNKLTGLTKLRLGTQKWVQRGALQVAALPRCAPLQQLDLCIDAFQVSTATQGASHSDSSGSAGSPYASPQQQQQQEFMALLCYVGCLTELTKLSLQLGSEVSRSVVLASAVRPACKTTGSQGAMLQLEQVANVTALLASSSLQHLKFALHGAPQFKAACWQQLLQAPVHPHLQGLRTLEATGPMEGFAWGSSSNRGVIAQLTSLQKLVLVECAVHPEVLFDTTELTHLALYTVSIASSIKQFGTVESTQLGSMFLAALAGLQQLGELHLACLTAATDSGSSRGSSSGNGINIHGTSSHPCKDPQQGLLQAQWWPAVSDAYTALMASSKLTKLRVVGCQLPAMAWQYAFTASHTLPCLTSLELRDSCTVSAGLHTDTIAGLVRCCPNLRSCQFNLGTGASLAAMPQLTALTTLELGCVDSAAIQQVAVLSCLKRLRRLHLECVQSLSSRGLLQLTKLTQLDQLQLSGAAWLQAHKPTPESASLAEGIPSLAVLNGISGAVLNYVAVQCKDGHKNLPVVAWVIFREVVGYWLESSSKLLQLLRTAYYVGSRAVSAKVARCVN